MANHNHDAANHHVDDEDVFSEQYAALRDAQDPLRHLRQHFLIPSQADLRATALPEAGKPYLLPRVPNMHALSPEAKLQNRQHRII